MKLLARLATQFEGAMKQDMFEFILGDIRNRSDLAFALLYQEYNIYLSQQPGSSLDSYEFCLFTLLSGLQEKPEQRDGCVHTHTHTKRMVIFSLYMSTVTLTSNLSPPQTVH